MNMKASRCWQPILLAGALFGASPASADILFDLIPADGSVSGTPGSLVGWGYSITNTDPSDWFLSTDLNSDSFSNGTPTLLFDFPEVAPGATVTEAFDPANSIGLFELQWDPSAPIGTVNSGNFVLSGELWDGDPFNGGTFIADALDSSAAYTATVTGSASTPEPASFPLLASGFAIMIGWRMAKNLRRFRLLVPQQRDGGD
jgi:hypothetical protein